MLNGFKMTIQKCMNKKRHKRRMLLLQAKTTELVAMRLGESRITHTYTTFHPDKLG